MNVEVLEGPPRCRRMISSEIGMNDWWGHSPHFTRGFRQMPGFHSLLQAGAYPNFPVLAFSQRTGKTSPRPAKRRRKSAILFADGEFFVTSGVVAGTSVEMRVDTPGT